MRTLKGDYDKILTLPAARWLPSLIALKCELCCHGPVLVVELSTLLACSYPF